MSIFISVVAYRDPQLESTLRSAIENAAFPEALKFGIVNQDVKKVDYSFLSNYSLITISPQHAKGVGFARAKAMDLYCEEDYYLQVDSHTQFSKNWDIKCIDQLKLAQDISRNKNVILSSYPAPYSLDGDKPFIHTVSTEEYPVEPTKQKVWLRTDDQWSALRLPFDDLSYTFPEESTTVLGGFIFANGNIVKEIPYDPDMSFFGEEICFAMRAWTRGWDIYSPSVNIVYHFYRRHGFKKIWSDEVRREKNWDQLQEISKNKQARVLCGVEEGTYGAGSVRTLKEYEDFTGFNFKKIYDRLITDRLTKQ